jgi:2-C-methyl-D-erythritol 4-phosphate cytidylyltransferase
VPRVTTAAILLAGGAGARTGSSVNKVYVEIQGRPLLAYALETLDLSKSIDTIVLVARHEDRQRAEDVVSSTVRQSEVAIVDGGVTRQESELRGLEALAERIDMFSCIAIHDGARPFLSLSMLESLVETACRVGGAIPGYVPEKTLFRPVDGALEPMGDVHAVQTPQCFRAAPLFAAYRAAKEVGFEGVDTAETVERFSDLTIAVVPADPRAFKITFEDDFARAERIAADWSP